MKMLLQFLAPTIRAALEVIVFTVGVGWIAFLSVQLVVHAESDNVKKEIMELHVSDMNGIKSRFDDMKEFNKERFDRLENLIKEGK